MAGKGLITAWCSNLACCRIICFFIVAFIVFILTFSYTRRITVMGEISTYPRSSNVYASVQGVVVKQFVTEGQLLKKGDAIYMIDVSKSTRSGVVSDNQRMDVDNQLTRIAQITDLLQENKRNTLEMLRKQKEQYSAALKRSSDIIPGRHSRHENEHGKLPALSSARTHHAGSVDKPDSLILRATK